MIFLQFTVFTLSTFSDNMSSINHLSSSRKLKECIQEAEPMVHLVLSKKSSY